MWQKKKKKKKKKIQGARFKAFCGTEKLKKVIQFLVCLVKENVLKLILLGQKHNLFKIMYVNYLRQLREFEQGSKGNRDEVGSGGRLHGAVLGAIG